jgi:NADH-quinone oxidoreductase subunit L
LAGIVRWIWIIPVLPAIASGIAALLPRGRRKLAAGLAIGSMALVLVFTIWTFTVVLAQPLRHIANFRWLQFGSEWITLGVALDPLTAIMLLMIAIISLLVFVYSLGYMAHDGNIVRFFCFLSLFAAAMFGVVLANSLLLLFMCWELVGLTSYLLIGFWYHRPAAAAAAKKAFLTTRIGDLALLLGMVWLYSRTGTLVFYDHGTGCLEGPALQSLLSSGLVFGMPVAAAIGILIFCGAVGKSGQLPLHVWLPDAMEGPTPVSALIHAATMVAAGVYLVARVYPLMALSIGGRSIALEVVAWIGALTAIFAACVAIAQNDIKRILAYSTISQLGYMMLGLAVGGVAVGIFHLITHAFFKALLFLGAGSVIHGCTEEQDIRSLGGLRRRMPVTFATYSIGTLALCGFPFFFSGFWSKDAILEAAHHWNSSQVPFYLGAIGALLTAFYMTRQVCYVFFGEHRQPAPVESPRAPEEYCIVPDPHESPRIMTRPLVVLAVFAVVLGFFNTPAWPWMTAFLDRSNAPAPTGLSTAWLPAVEFSHLFEGGLLPLMLLSSLIVFFGIGFGWLLYGRRPPTNSQEPDLLERKAPALFRPLEHRLYVDEFYQHTFLLAARWASNFSAWLDRRIWDGFVRAAAAMAVMLGWLDAGVDRHAVNAGFDEGCREVAKGGQLLSYFQNGRTQRYLRAIAAALIVLAALMLWRSAA